LLAILHDAVAAYGKDAPEEVVTEACVALRRQLEHGMEKDNSLNKTKCLQAVKKLLITK